tara:strand:+ start:22055 stop:22369 length:315 start_codon:yes stop_codon:yes gene_type:complete
MTDNDTLRAMQRAALSIGKVEWGGTHELDAKGHAEQTKTSVDITAETFGQSGPQKMSGLYLEGTETVLCHTGTSPNSPTHARILTALWNNFVEQTIKESEASHD